MTQGHSDIVTQWHMGFKITSTEKEKALRKAYDRCLPVCRYPSLPPILTIFSCHHSDGRTNRLQLVCSPCKILDRVGHMKAARHDALVWLSNRVKRWSSILAIATLQACLCCHGFLKAHFVLYGWSPLHQATAYSWCQSIENAKWSLQDPSIAH